MGKEATCLCQHAQGSGQVKAILEAHELILRGSLRRTIPISAISHVEVKGDQLHLQAGADNVVLTLGAFLAQSWAKKISLPPPTLAQKLGISSTTNLLLIGEFETEELKTASAQAATTSIENPDLILASLTTAAELTHMLDSYQRQSGSPPLWIIYPKGPRSPLGESAIRTSLRLAGFLDTKVASVSATLTALRFCKRDGSERKSPTP